MATKVYKPKRKISATESEEIKIPASSVDGLSTVATSGSYNDLSSKPTIPDVRGLMPKSGGTFTGEVKFGSTENFQGYYIKRMLGYLGIGTRYADLDSSYKDGTWHRMWRLRFPSGSDFWGKIKITLYGGYSSFNASGVMSKSITCNFNKSNIYNNVGCYDGLGVNVEQDFRISEAIWNATVSAWEVLIWQQHLNGNNSPVIMLECWTANNPTYINAFNGITAQPVELTQSTSYSAQRASSTGGTKTVEWATLPVYENPLGEEIATIAMLPAAANNGTLTIQKNGTDVATFTANQSSSVTANITVPTKASDVNALSLDGGTINKSKTIKMDASANSDGANLKWGTVNHKNPYIGYASDQTDGTFVVGSLLGTNYASGLAIGGGSGNLLWKGTKVATINDIPPKVTESTVSGWGFTKNTGTVTSVAVKMNGATKGTVTSSGTIDLGTVITDVSGKLDKTTYEVNKTINFGQDGVLYVGKFKVYDTNVTCEVTSTTDVTYSGKLVIATQNYVIKQMTVYGDAANTVAPNFYIKPSTTSDPYIEVYFKPSSWSKNVVHIYGSEIKAEPTNVCTSVPAVPSTATLKPTNALNSKANLAGDNTFTGGQIITGANEGYSINASGYIKGSWLQAPSTGHSESGTGRVCVMSSNGWIYYRTPSEILTEAGGGGSGGGITPFCMDDLSTGTFGSTQVFGNEKEALYFEDRVLGIYGVVYGSSFSSAGIAVTAYTSAPNTDSNRLTIMEYKVNKQALSKTKCDITTSKSKGTTTYSKSSVSGTFYYKVLK